MSENKCRKLLGTVLEPKRNGSRVKAEPSPNELRTVPNGLMGVIKAISISKEKGVKKANVKSAKLKKDYGIIGDAHAGTLKRQVSLLAEESIRKMREKGLKVGPGDFAENITTQGIDLLSLKLGERLRVGNSAVLEISQIGKVCHTRCSIYYQAGDCVMPKEGIFARVLKGGSLKVGDRLEVM